MTPFSHAPRWILLLPLLVACGPGAGTAGTLAPEGVVLSWEGQAAISLDDARAIVAGKKPGANEPQNPDPFTIENQLRRIFQSKSGNHLLDAYAIAVSADVVTLLRIDNLERTKVVINRLCEADRYWIARNTNKIRNHGRRVELSVLKQNR